MSGQKNDKDEFDRLKSDVGDFISTPRIKSAFSAASTPLKIAGGALAVGLLIKPALLVAFGAAVYGGVSAVTAYNDYDGGDGPGGSGGPGGNEPPKGPKPDDLTFR